MPAGTDMAEWPKTDFTACAFHIAEILPGGPRRDVIRAIDAPHFVALAQMRMTPKAPLVVVSVNGDTHAYPLGVLIWHEIVNDVVGGMPVAVTYCPSCNAAIVFDRRHDGHVLDFGTTGYLRHADLVMYDRRTESWWQQYDGRGLIGRYSGAQLKTLPSRLMGYGALVTGRPNALIMPPPEAAPGEARKPYGANPYIGYDSGFPMLFRGQVPRTIAPMARVVVAADKAWSFDYLAENGPVRYQGLTLSWQPGQASALDHQMVDAGRDVGSVSVTRNGAPVVHKVTFAFVVHAFEPQREIIHMPR